MTAAPATSAADALAEHLEQFIDANIPTDGEHPQAREFVIENMEQATWAARKIRAARQRADEIGEAAEAEANRIRAWRDDAMRPHLDTIEHLSHMLRYYHETRFREDDRCKSIKLPHDVTLASRAQQPQWDIDSDAFIAWAKVNAPELVKRTITYAVPVADLKAAAKGDDAKFVREGDLLHHDGDVVPGVVITDRDRTFDVKVG